MANAEEIETVYDNIAAPSLADVPAMLAGVTGGKPARKKPVEIVAKPKAKSSGSKAPAAAKAKISAKTPTDEHIIKNIRITELVWGDMANKAALPPPDNQIAFDLMNSRPSVHNALRRVIMSELTVYAMVAMTIKCSDIYVNLDELKLRVSLLPIKQIASDKIYRIKVMNNQPIIRVVYSDEMTPESPVIGNARIATLQPGETLDLEISIQSGTAEDGAGYRVSGAFQARGYDYFNVQLLNVAELASNRWVDIRDLPADAIAAIADGVENIRLVERGAKFERIEGSPTKVYVVDAFPPAQSSTCVVDSNFYLAFRFGPQYKPKQVMVAACECIIEHLVAIRDNIIQNRVAFETVEQANGSYGVCHITNFNWATYGHLLLAAVLALPDQISATLKAEGRGFKLKIQHPDYQRVLRDMIEQLVGIFDKIKQAFV